MRIVVTGPKASGKTTIGTALSRRLRVPFADLDDIVLESAREEGMEVDSCRDLFGAVGEEAFRAMERNAISALDRRGCCVLATGGSSLLDRQARDLLRPGSLWVRLQASPERLWERISHNPVPAYLRDVADPYAEFVRRVECIDKVLLPLCDLVVRTEAGDINAIVECIVTRLQHPSHGMADLLAPLLGEED